MSEDAERAFAETVYRGMGGRAQVGRTQSGEEVGLAILPLPDGIIRITIGFKEPRAVVRMNVPAELVAQWGSLLTNMAHNNE